MEIISFVSQFQLNINAQNLLHLNLSQQKKLSQKVYSYNFMQKCQQLQRILSRLFTFQLQYSAYIEMIDKNCTSNHLLNTIHPSKNQQIIKEIIQFERFKFKIKVKQYYFTELQFQIFNYLIIDSQLKALKIQAVLLKKGIPLQIKCKNIKLLFVRFLNKLNSKLYGSTIKLDYHTGRIYLIVQWILTKAYFTQLIQQNKAFEKYVKNLLQNALDHMKQNLVDILYLIEEIQRKELNRNNSAYIINFLKDHEEIIDKICKCIYLSKIEYQLFFNKKKSNDDQKKINKIIKNLNTVCNHNNYSFQNKYYKNLNFQKQWLQTNSSGFNKYLKIPTLKPNKQDSNISILSKIIILNTKDIKYEYFKMNSYSQLKKADIKFVYSETDIVDQSKPTILIQNLPKFARKVVLKQDVNSRNRVAHQKKILNTEKIRGKGFSYLIKCYHSIQNQFKNFLIMDYCIHQSLLNYKANNKITLSILTKIYILCQVVQGLRQCKQCDIIHLDLKPENILIDKNLGVKLTDFGQSYHHDIEQCKLNYQPGYTFPYCSPQIFKTEIPFTQKLDVFSFGVLMYQFLFQFLPFQLQNISHQKFVRKYKDENFNIGYGINLQMASKVGPQLLFQPLIYLSSKCIRNVEKQRPYLNWIIIILRESLSYLDKLY